MRNRKGITLLECIVAGGLLLVAVSLVGSLTSINSRLWQQSRYHRLALEELTNQMDYLKALPDAERISQLEQLQPSELVQETLPQPVLSGEILEDSLGQRLILRIQWDRMQQLASLELVGWLKAPIEKTNIEGTEQ